MSTDKSTTEQLVDEISEELNRLYRAARGGRTPEQKPRDMAGNFIVRIGQAVLSGEDPELDMALGVRGRIEIIPPKKGRRWIELGYQAFLDELRVGDTLIALRCPTGTGLEEAIANLEAHSERLEEFIALRLQAVPGEEE